MNAISIADKKAAILIRINTTIISASIVFEGYFKEISAYNNQIIPVLIVGLSISLIFAILAAKPFSYIMYKVAKNGQSEPLKTGLFEPLKKSFQTTL